MYFTIAILGIFSLILANCTSKDHSHSSHSDHSVHADHNHKHGEDCGHKKVKHHDHFDYVHNGHYHLFMVTMLTITETVAESRSTASADHKIHSPHKHKHGKNCGHKAVVHGDHVDYLHDGHYHHVHGDHVDDHGLVVKK